MSLPITALYASLCGILIVILSLKVVRHRRKFQVGIGSGDEKILERAIRAHANAVEYIPIALILLALFEANKGYEVMTHAMGILLVIARVFHAHGLSSFHGKTFGRFWGTAITWAVINILSVSNLVLFFL